MDNITQINNLELEIILQRLWVRYKKLWWTLSLYEGNKLTDGYKADINKWIVSDFAEKWRPSGDRIKFVSEYLWVDNKETIKWFIDNFNLIDNFKPTKKLVNPIKDKRVSLSYITETQEEYLKARGINPEWLDFIKNYNWNIALPIQDIIGNIKSIQSRVPDNEAKIRYYVERNTDSDWLFFSWINKEDKRLIVVEWFTDFLTIRQYTPNVVWLLNAKNPSQIDMIKELSRKYEIFFIPDNDEAWLTTVEKFKEKWIKFNQLKLEQYWVKDINEAVFNYGLWENILDVIYLESEKPISNLRLALQKATEYKRLYKENNWRLWFPSWYEKLDKYTGWVIAWKVYMIMAYSNVWKTRFAYSFVKNLIKEKKRIRFYSLEVDTGMLVLELLSTFLEIKKEEVLDRLETIDLTEFEKYIEVYDDVRTLEWIEEHLKLDTPDVAFIDFIQNIEHKWSEYEKMSDIAIRLQKSAILTWVSLFNISQVANDSRFAEWVNMLPKWSWALFASSDVIFSLWGKEGDKFVTISKNKFWPVGIDFLAHIDYSTSNFRLTEDFPKNTWWDKKYDFITT